MKPEPRNIWLVVLCLATVQMSVAIFAVYSSSQDILSDGACIGGIFGTLANFIILAAVGVTILVLGFMSFRAGEAHPALLPFYVLAVSTVLAITIGVQAGLRCTV